MKPILALSTSWCSSRHMDGYAMLREMADLGFGHVELSHGIRITLVPGILKGVEEGFIKVSSVHNFCPLPTGVLQAAPNLFEPTAIDPKERDQWLRHTKRSIDFAAQLGARVVVLHLGSVRFLWFNPGRRLQALADRHPGVDLRVHKAFGEQREKAMKKLRSRLPPFLERLRDSLEKVREYAAGKGIALGFENREKFEELPIDSDFEELLAGLAKPNSAGYWHDTGHADLKERFGLLNHRAHLEKNAGRLLGFHLHDVDAEGNDHQPVGAGTVDFKMISSFWRPEHLLVLEFGPRLSVDDVTRSKKRIEQLL